MQNFHGSNSFSVSAFHQLQIGIRCSHICCNMSSQEDLKRKREAIILHHQLGKTNAEIVRLLKNANVNKMLVSRTIKRFAETGSTEKRRSSGRPRSKRTPAMVKALRSRIRRNPRQRQQKLALQMAVSWKTIQRALKIDLGLKALKRTTCHMLSVKQKKARVQKCRKLLKRYALKRSKPSCSQMKNYLTLRRSLTGKMTVFMQNQSRTFQNQFVESKGLMVLGQ